MKQIDCDVFMKDCSILDMDEIVSITGNFYAGKHCYVSTAIIAGGDVILEDYTDTVGIFAEGKVEIGDFSDSMTICSRQSISLGSYTYAHNVLAAKDVFLGYQVKTSNIFSGGDIFLTKHCTLRVFFIQLFRKIKYWLLRE